MQAVGIKRVRAIDFFMSPLLAEPESGSVWFCTLDKHDCEQFSGSAKSTVLPPMISRDGGCLLHGD